MFFEFVFNFAKPLRSNEDITNHGFHATPVECFQDVPTKRMISERGRETIRNGLRKYEVTTRAVFVELCCEHYEHEVNIPAFLPNLYVCLR